MSPTDAIPLLIVVLLVISIGGGEVQEMSVTFQGENSLDALSDVHVVAGGTATVPSEASVGGDIYGIGGTTRIDGRVEGDITLLAGNLSISDGATVAGTVQTISGDATIADGADIGSVTRFRAPSRSTSPLNRVGGLVFQLIALGGIGWWLVTRHPLLLENVGAAITDHALVSGVVGGLGATTLLVLFVYMAFTIILIPLAIIGLLAELLVVIYGQVVFGYLVGTKLPLDGEAIRTVAGIAIFLLFVEFLSLLPYLGGVVQIALAAIGFGAVLTTYFGFTAFEPVSIPGAGSG